MGHVMQETVVQDFRTSGLQYSEPADWQDTGSGSQTQDFRVLWQAWKCQQVVCKNTHDWIVTKTIRKS